MDLVECLRHANQDRPGGQMAHQQAPVTEPQQYVSAKTMVKQEEFIGAAEAVVEEDAAVEAIN
jgi:hypothetical protein